MDRVLEAIRRNLVAWLALFVALGGTGIAASHYIITSTKQIKPSVGVLLEDYYQRGDKKNLFSAKVEFKL